MNKIIARFLVALVVVSLCLVPMAGSQGGVLAGGQVPPAKTPASPSATTPTPYSPSAGTNSIHPTYQWSNTGAQMYEIDVYNGSKLAYWYYVLSYNCGQVCQFVPPKKLKVNATYTWYIWAYDSSGWSSSGGPLNFTVSAPFNSTFKNVKGWYDVWGPWFWLGGYLITTGDYNNYDTVAHVGIYDTYTYNIRIKGTGPVGYIECLYFNGIPYPNAFMKDWNTSYMLCVRNDGDYSFWESSGGGSYYPWVDWTYVSGLVNGSDFNVLGVTYNTLTGWTGLYINYYPVIYGFFTDYTHGAVGLGVAAHDPSDQFFVDYATLVSGAPAYLVASPDDKAPIQPVVIDTSVKPVVRDGVSPWSLP